MSRENMEIVREGYAAFNRGGPEAMIGKYWAEDLVWDVTTIGFPGPGVYRGLDEVRAFFADWFGVFGFDEWYAEVDRLIEHGDQVVAFVRQRGRGGASATPAEMEMTQILTLKEGRIIRIQVYLDRQQALEAVGMSEPVRSRENVELAEAAYAAVNRRDLDAFLTMLHPEVEFRSLVAEAEGRDYRGHAGAREWWESVVQSLGGMHAEVEYIEAAEDGGVIRVRIVGHADGVEVAQAMWMAFRVRDGLVRWWSYFRTEAEALEALGPRE
jgi:ketosteroid isomerase-like protein